MAGWVRDHWERRIDAPSSRDRRGGPYRLYLPDPLVTRPLVVDAALDAEFAPPPPERVSPLMHDLADYITGAVHAPLVQAG